jgi:hypothetical protein
MNEYNMYDDGSGSMAMEYPKSDNNGSVSNASTIPKDGGHLKGGSEEVVERDQTENPKLARAPTVVKEYCAFDSKWVPPVGGAPSRHTGTGGAADGVHAQCLRDSAQVLGRGVEWCPEASS